MKLDFSCPIELRGVTVTGGENRLTAEFSLYNLSSHRIDSFDAVAKWRSASGRSLACPFTAGHLRASGKNMFTYTLINDRMPDAESVDLLFTSVHYEDGTPDWHAGDGPYVQADPQPAPSHPEISHLYADLASDTFCCSSQREELLTCACGRIHSRETIRCAHCQHTLEEVLQQADRRPVRPAANEPSIEYMQQQNLQKKRRLFRRTFLLAIAALTAVAILAVSAPAVPSVRIGISVASISRP